MTKKIEPIEQLNIILVPHTHWDREWYQTFQQFRVRLVKTVDRLLDILDHDDSFTHFLLDGQTIVLDDYLEIRPDQEARLKRYTHAGRIQVGPWYVQPDEFLVSGEALIRNLQIGFRRATEFGNLMRVGYVPDCFGHIAQLPQILQGFGIESAVFWRGVGSDLRCSEFSWVAPDGSAVLVIHLADPMGYSNARTMPLNPEEFVTRVELLSSNLLPKATTNTLLFMNGSDHLEPQDGLPAVIAAANQLLAQIDPERQRLLPLHLHQHDGHNPAVSNGSPPRYNSINLQIGTLPQYIEQIRRQHPQLETLNGELRSSQFSHLLPAVLSSRIWIKQQNAATEHLLENWVEPLSAWASILGAPYPNGLVSLAWKYLLQNHPHDSICGCSIDQVHRENSVRFAQSQQIAESVIDQSIHDIAANVDTRAPIPTTHPSQEPVPIVVFNPGPGPRSEQVQTIVQLPGSLFNAAIVDEHGTSMPFRVFNRWRQEIGSMPIAREMLATAAMLSGVTSPEQLISMAHNLIMSAIGQPEDAFVISRFYIEGYSDSPIHHDPRPNAPGVIYIEVMIAPRGRVVVNEEELTIAGQHILSILQREDIHTLEVSLVDQARETIEFLAADLPAHGLKTFWLYPRGLQPGTTPAQASTLVAGPDTIENEYYHISVNPQNATLTVTDKESGTIFEGLNHFIDSGDVGDLYTYCPPERDTVISAPNEPAKIEVINTGPVCATLRITSRWSLPAACTSNRNERSSRTAACPITSEITLTPGVKRIDIHTTIDNKARDHRLRVLFPFPGKPEHIASEGTFEVRERPIAPQLPQDFSSWAEDPVATFPQKRFVDLSDDHTGLAILNRGLPECEILQPAASNAEASSDEKIPFAAAITLLRSVEWLSRGDLSTRRGHAGPMEHTPEAQCLGSYEFDYALVPHRGTWESDNAQVLRQAQAFNLPLINRALVTDQHAGPLPSSAALVTVDHPELVVSAIKHSERGIIVRLYNPLSIGVEATITPGFAFQQAHLANLLEEPQKVLKTASDPRSLNVYINGGSIVTLLLN